MTEETAFRLVFLLVFLSTLMISGYHRKRARQAGETIPRRAEGSTALLLRASMALVVAVSYLTYVFAPQGLSWARIGLSSSVRWGAAALALGVLPALWWALVTLGANISETVLTKSTHRLVTHGPYRWIRHPIYALALFQMTMLALIASNAFLLLFPILGTVVFRLVVIPKEESHLLAAFGKQYEDYRARTGALLPRLRP